jgi:hypothetical protein
MTSITAADLKLGGRLTAACDAIAENKLRTAAGIFLEIGGDLNVEAETSDGLLAPEEDDWSVVRQPAASPAPNSASLQMCSRGVHSYGPIDNRGWATCAVCGNVNVAPDRGGPVDMGQYK